MSRHPGHLSHYGSSRCMSSFAQGCWVRSGEFGESFLQDPVMDAGEEHGVAQAGAVVHLVAVGVRDALDEAVLAEPRRS